MAAIHLEPAPAEATYHVEAMVVRDAQIIRSRPRACLPHWEIKMKHINGPFSCLFTLGLLAMTPALVTHANAETTSKAISVTETRFKTLDKAAKDDVVPVMPSSLTVSVELKGEMIVDAVGFGSITFKATDDKGNDLKPITFGLSGDGDMQPIDRHQMWLGLDDPPKDRIRLDLHMAAPPRSATKLAAIEGSIKLQVGKGKEIFIANPANKVKKELEDALLKQAGIKVTLESFDPTGGAFVTYARVKAEGKIGSLAKMEVVDEAGKSLGNGSSITGFGDTASYEVLGTDALPAGARVKLTVITDMKVIEVPIKLMDLELP